MHMLLVKILLEVTTDKRTDLALHLLTAGQERKHRVALFSWSLSILTCSTDRINFKFLNWRNLSNYNQNPFKIAAVPSQKGLMTAGKFRSKK